MDYPRASIELIVEAGSNPPAQRNRAAQKASGDIFYFVDNDVQIGPALFRKASGFFASNPSLSIVGGPAFPLVPPSLNGECVRAFLRSPFGAGPFYARYAQVGKPRPTDERELILCNLFVRKGVFMESGFFPETLFPGEETEWLERLRRKKVEMYYSPELSVHHPVKAGGLRHFRQMLRQGTGRGLQVRRYPALIIPALAVPLFALVSLSAVCGMIPKIFLLPYLFFLLGPAVSHPDRLRWRVRLLLPVFVLVSHLCYGSGWLIGLIRSFVPLHSRAGTTRL